jgi:hypothetical protein
MASIVDRTVDLEQWHSTISPSEELEAWITSGSAMDKYRFRNYGMESFERKIYEVANKTRIGKRNGGALEYARKWKGSEVLECDFNEVKRLNPKINTICQMINGMRNKSMPKTNAAESAEAGRVREPTKLRDSLRKKDSATWK